MEIALSCLWLALVAWLLGRAFRQRNALTPLAPTSGGTPPVAVIQQRGSSQGWQTNPGSGATPPVAVIIPARNESQNIGPCLESLLRLQYPEASLHLVVVDDGSADDTAAIAARLAAENSPRITLLRAPPLPPGWKGKPHACWLGAQAACAHAGNGANPKWLCFLDADMRVQPALLGSAIESATSDNIDLLSLTPRHELLSVAERLILPCGLYLLGFSQDLRRLQAPGSEDVVATGQFMLMRRSAYERTGGHAAVYASVCEDLELARLFKRSGQRVQLQDGSRLLTTRMYTGWRTLWPGIAKNLTETLGGPLKTLATAAAAVLMAWATLLLPLLDGVECHRASTHACIALLPALLGSAAVVALHIAGAIHFGIPIWYGLLFPLGYTTGALLAVDSVRWRLRGRVVWKGRIYE